MSILGGMDAILDIRKSLPGISARKRFAVSAFRLVALSAAILHLSFFTTDANDLVPPLTLIVAVTMYTGFKLAHPTHWYRSKWLGPVLLLLDVVVSAVLVELSGELHGPFGLYTLAPVVASAVLLPRKVTLTTAIVTAVYMTFSVLRDPVPEIVDLVTGRLAIYLMALGLTATMPYVVNSGREQRLQSAAMLGERRRLGREIHDSFCQTVYGLRWQLNMLKHDAVYNNSLAEKVGRLEILLEQAEKEARGFVDLLRSFRTERPFLSQLQESLDHLKKDTGIDCLLAAEDGEPELDDIVKIEVLYVCEEALQNVAKHSAARHVAATVRSLNGLLLVSITDDGRGIDDAKSGGHGLAVMKERAESVGGRLVITSIPGTGTEIRVEAPTRCPVGLPKIR